MALSLAACGGSSTTTTTTPVEDTVAPAVDSAMTLTFDKNVIDVLKGGTGNDTAIGDSNVVAADQVDLGDGVDTVKLYTVTALPDMTNVETLELVSQADAVNLDVSETGITTLVLNKNSAGENVYTIGASMDVKIVDTALDNHAHVIELNHAATDTATTVTLDGVTSAGTSASLEIDGAALATVNLNTSGTKSSVDQIVNALGKVTKLDIGADVALTVVDDMPTGIKTIDASDSTAAVDLAVGTVDLTYTGGAGDDRLDIGAISNLTAADTLTGGAGKDTVATSDSGAEFTSSELTLIKAELAGFEVLEFTHTHAGTAGGTELDIDFNGISVINEVLISADLTGDEGTMAATATATSTSGEIAIEVTGAEAGDNLVIGDDENVIGGVGGAGHNTTVAKGSAGADGANGAVAISITEELSTADDSFTITLSGNNDITGGAGGRTTVYLSGAAATGAEAGDGANAISATGIETLTIVSNGDGTTADNNNIAGGAAGSSTGTGDTAGSAGASVAMGTNGKIVVEGTQALDLGTISGTNVQVDASSFSGKLTVTGEAGNNIITGGSAADTIDGGEGIDTLTGNGGADIFVFTTAANSDTAAADIIKDYEAGVDVLRFVSTDNVAGAGAIGTTATSDVQVAAGGLVTFAAADDTLAEKLTAIAADTGDVGTNEVAFFEHGGNTYVFNNVGGTDDLVVLEGLTGMTTLTESTTTAGDFIIA